VWGREVATGRRDGNGGACTGLGDSTPHQKLKRKDEVESHPILLEMGEKSFGDLGAT